VKRQPREATNPPNTAERRVLFLLQMETHTGEKNNEIPSDRAPSQPEIVSIQYDQNQSIIFTGKPLL
jgi:hypothetical protein